MAFLAQWLRIQSATPGGGMLRVDELRATDGVGKAELRVALGHELRRNYVDLH